MGNSPATGEFPSQRPVTRCFEVFFDLRLNNQLSKQLRRRWFETQSRLLWHHCNEPIAPKCTVCRYPPIGLAGKVVITKDLLSAIPHALWKPVWSSLTSLYYGVNNFPVVSYFAQFTGRPFWYIFFLLMIRRRAVGDGIQSKTCSAEVALGNIKSSYISIICHHSDGVCSCWLETMIDFSYTLNDECRVVKNVNH